MARQKKIDTWKFHDMKTGYRVEIPVYLCKSVSGYGTESSNFQVSLPALEINECDVDLNVLKERVYKLIREKSQITWERWLMVTTDGKSDYHTATPEEFLKRTDSLSLKLKGGLDIEIHSVEVAKKADGKYLARDHQYHNAHGQEGLPATGDVPNAGMRAMIPDTPENREALARIITAMSRLEKQLKTMLTPDQIESSLSIVLENKGLAALMSPMTLEKKMR